ncbi:MAG: hypothetical protein IV100_18420 [Myxococcales bacterium]|nr:hypothetical protein [Myxococcales bacterium]
MSSSTSETLQSTADIAEGLSRADVEIGVAIDSFKRAYRFNLRDLFRKDDDMVREEVHVSHGLSALLNAERHVSAVAAGIDALPWSDRARGQLGPRVRMLNAAVRSVMTELSARPDPSRVVSQLKAARRAIPSGLGRLS